VDLKSKNLEIVIEENPMESSLDTVML